MVAQILNETLFVGTSDDSRPVFLDNSTLKALCKVNRQIKNDFMSEMLSGNAESMKNGMNSVVIAQFSMNLVMSSAMSMVIGMFNVL